VSTFIASARADIFEKDRKCTGVCMQCFLLLLSGLFTLCQQQANNLVTTILIFEITNQQALTLPHVPPRGNSWSFQTGLFIWTLYILQCCSTAFTYRQPIRKQVTYNVLPLKLCSFAKFILWLSISNWVKNSLCKTGASKIPLWT
jgi:hypothetical protein